MALGVSLKLYTKNTHHFQGYHKGAYQHVHVSDAGGIRLYFLCLVVTVLTKQEADYLHTLQSLWK